jgi:hypothetical protein
VYAADDIVPKNNGDKNFGEKSPHFFRENLNPKNLKRKLLGLGTTNNNTPQCLLKTTLRPSEPEKKQPKIHPTPARIRK